MTLFLTPEELAELTGIKTGKAGKTREQRQLAHLKAQRIPHFVSAAGYPKVARATIEGASAPQTNLVVPVWEPAREWQPGPAVTCAAA
jgi:Domain of unknown function (DUF4224)